MSLAFTMKHAILIKILVSNQGLCPLLSLQQSQCLKFTQKVAFNIASEASYVCILSIKNSLKVPKMVNLGTFWKTEATWKQCYQTGQFQKGKNWWKGPKLKNWQWDILGDFQPLWGPNTSTLIIFSLFQHDERLPKGSDGSKPRRKN